MNSTAVTTLDLRVIESVLEMGGGYVLDFSDHTFASFFQEHLVDIEDARFVVEGSSKAKRLRYFLRATPSPLTGRVLADLLQHRLVSKPEGLIPNDLEKYRQIILRLGGELPLEANTTSAQSDGSTEADLPRHVFRPDLFTKLPVDSSMRQALVDRLEEAQRCIEVKANLARRVLGFRCLNTRTRILTWS